MAAVRLVRDPISLRDVVESLSHLKAAVRQVVPSTAEIRISITGSDDVMIEVLVPIFEDREATLFNLRAGLVPDYAFHSVSHGLEHGMRGRHRICALVDF